MVPPVVLVVLGGDAGGGLLAEPDVDAEVGQTLEVQLSALDAAAVAPANVFAEKKSGKAGSARPQWEDVRSRLRPADTLVVSKLDRMGRDMREIMETAWSCKTSG